MDIIDSRYIIDDYELEVTGTVNFLEYWEREDSVVTRFEVPAEYNCHPVVRISSYAFSECKYLQEVYVPDSVKTIGSWAFGDCPELRGVRLPAGVELEAPVFVNCPKLPPEVMLAGLVGAADLSKPLADIDDDSWDDILREDVFALAIKYDSFRESGTDWLFAEIVKRGLVSHFKTLEKAGKSPSAEQTDELINLSAENGKTEMTAYLLDLKNRKFGFNGGDKFEL